MELVVPMMPMVAELADLAVALVLEVQGVGTDAHVEIALEYGV